MSSVARATVKRRRGVLLPAAAVAGAVLLPLAALLMSALLLGWRFHVIETASMAPSLPAGSLAIVEPLDPADVRPGMTVVFEDPLQRGRLVAHRIVKRLPASSPAWQTKGDANAEADPAPVHAAAVKGRVRRAVPGLGGTLSSLDGWQPFALLVGLPLGLLLLTEISGARHRFVNDKRELRET